LFFESSQQRTWPQVHPVIAQLEVFLAALVRGRFFFASKWVQRPRLRRIAAKLA
jgi:hypothetical protein